MTDGRRRYWLMKSEPDCFSFADLLAAPERTSSGTGCATTRPAICCATNLAPGDGVLFYHSNIPQPAIVGIARVVGGGYPDHTALDPRSDHFDPRASSANPIWYMVDVQGLRPLPAPLGR